ncbi:MAG: hypothetical protein PHP30_05580 [Bacteroidales bacterium]|nr:hypothetical protein [Bacteroidales bacterium]MDD2425703.1 hypothetical protein [Bacteroidales bacterium]MDD3989550.1 hypothetical protein [Bacteroidales bacterium]
MIYIISDEGIMLDLSDSLEYVKWKIKEVFSCLEEFKGCIEIHHPTYWGDYNLVFEDEYYLIWINKIAESTLK